MISRWDKHDGVDIYLGIIPGALIFVLDEEANGCAKRDTVLKTGLELNEVLFITLYFHQLNYCAGQLVRHTYGSRQVALARTSAGELNLDVLVLKGQSLGKSQILMAASGNTLQ